MTDNCRVNDCQKRILVAALEQCAAPFSTAPGSVVACQAEISAEFQRRMNIAGEALSAITQAQCNKP